MYVYRTEFVGVKGIFVERSDTESKRKRLVIYLSSIRKLFSRSEFKSNIVCSFIYVGSRRKRSKETSFSKREKSHLTGGNSTREELSFLPSFHEISDLIKPFLFSLV